MGAAVSPVWPEEFDPGISENDSALVAPPRLEVSSLHELMQHPELLEPPPSVIPRIAYRGRATTYAGREKLGKTTLLAGASAAVSRGLPFLGGPTQRGRVLWLTEENMGEPVRRFAALDADPHEIDMALLPFEGAPRERVHWIAAAVARSRYTLVVVDTLTALLSGIRSFSDTAEVTAVMTPLVALAHEHDVALLLNAHARRSDNAYSGSFEFGARVDVIVEMKEVAALAYQRKLEIKGRFGTDALTVNYDGAGRYELAERGEQVHLDVQIMEYVTMHPDCVRTHVTRDVSGNDHLIAARLDALVLAGRLEVRAEPRGQAPATQRYRVQTIPVSSSTAPRMRDAD